MPNFKQSILRLVKNIPKGKVASYGQLAAAAGNPRAARQVGAILRGLDVNSGSLPWWRVVNNAGRLSIKGNWTATKELQRELLLKEGVLVDDAFSLDMGQFRCRL